MQPKEQEEENGIVVEDKGNDVVEQQKKTIENLTAEIQEVRKTRKEDRDALDALLKTKEEDTPDNDPTKIVEREFAKREAIQAEAERIDAEEDFKTSQKEFHPDNDPGEIKYKAFLRELKKFNLVGVTTKKGFQDRFKEAYEFMNRNKSVQERDNNSQFAATSKGDAGVRVVDDGSLTKTELALIKSKGWDSQRYLKLKISQPTYVNQLLRYMQN